jgi:hypothetical protein
VLTINQKVKEVHNCKPGKIPEFVFSSGQPIILKEFCDNWPAVIASKESDKAVADYLKRFSSNIPINAYYGAPENNGRVFYNEDLTGFNFNSSKATLNQVLDTLLAHIDDPKPPTMYVGSTEINRALPNYNVENNASIDYLKPLISIWVGNQSQVAAHFDFPNNLACCIAGSRRFTLFPPEQLENLYIGPMEFAPGGQEISLVDFDNPDFEKHPKFSQALATAQVAELSPGDALFIPSMWWHHVQSLTPFNLLVTHWWRDSPAFMGRPKNALDMAILSLKDLPLAQRKAWQAHFNYYIFEHDKEDFSHIPQTAQGRLTKPLDELMAKKIRADLLNKLKR